MHTVVRARHCHPLVPSLASMSTKPCHPRVFTLASMFTSLSPRFNINSLPTSGDGDPSYPCNRNIFRIKSMSPLNGISERLTTDRHGIARTKKESIYTPLLMKTKHPISKRPCVSVPSVVQMVFRTVVFGQSVIDVFSAVKNALLPLIALRHYFQHTRQASTQARPKVAGFSSLWGEKSIIKGSQINKLSSDFAFYTVKNALLFHNVLRNYFQHTSRASVKACVIREVFHLWGVYAHI